ncbi:MAG: metallophosphoesterase [Pirellulaceae bacterium]|nr:metallophosphoesterase [Pirellulaceae bacterium]
MPAIFHQPISRTDFLKISTGFLGALVVRPQPARANQDSTAAYQIALLSDTHIPSDATETYRGFAPVQNLKQVIPQVTERKPAATIINGDAARLMGNLEDYQMLKGLLEPLAQQSPVYIGLGNHDDRDNFSKIFSGKDDTNRQSVNGKNVLVVEHPTVRTIVLDSLLYVDKTAGLLGKTQRRWLAKYLTDADNRPTVLFVHHSLGDGDGELLDVDRLFRIIEPHKNVKAVFYGHSHRYKIDRRGDLFLVNLPAVGYPFGASEPVGWIDAIFDTNGVDLTLHAVGGNLEKNGQTTRLDW